MSIHPLEQYYFDLPKNLLGQQPAEPRDHARLFIYDTKQNTIQFDHFYNIANYLPADSLMVLNNTGVIPARVVFTKDTGGKVEGLILVNEGIQADGTIPTIVNKQIIVGRKLYIDKYEFEILRQTEQYFYLKPLFDKVDISEILIQYGTTPTPKYLGKLELSEEELRQRYQTIFANQRSSVAAPTASLHFTNQVFQSLDAKSIRRQEVTLHVGMGTFAEVTEANMQSKTLHTEPIQISVKTKEAIRIARNESRKVIAVGTTSLRTIESLAEHIRDEHHQGEILARTNLFIQPGYQFQIADIMITNFHTPRSSLMSLVDAFLQDKGSKKSVLDLYQIAIEKEFRFYSFGDSMLIV